MEKHEGRDAGHGDDDDDGGGRVRGSHPSQKYGDQIFAET